MEPRTEWDRGKIEPWAPASPLVVVATGELDVASGSELRERVERALEAGVTALVVDLSAVNFIDSVSLAVLVAAKRRMGPNGRLAIVVGGSYVELVLAATRLDKVLDVFEDRSAAEAFAFG